MFGWLKKVFGGIKRVGKATPAVVRNPGVQVGLSFLGVPPGAINMLVPMVAAVEKASKGEYSKFGRVLAEARPMLEHHGITKKSDINLAIEIALAVLEGRMKVEAEA